MIVKAIKTRPLIPPQDDLFSAIEKSFLKIQLKEKSIIAVTSKVVSIHQGRCIKNSAKIKKDELAKKEADFYLDRKSVPNNRVMLTIKDGILISSAGIDESNAKDHFILWPEEPFLFAKKLHDFFTNKYNIKKLGVIITDSHCIPQRRGVIGIAIAYYGFYPLKDYRGEKDIFGKKLKVSITNIPDSLAVVAVLAMGEGKEQTPIAVIEDVGDIKFSKHTFKKDPLKIDIKEDIYAPMLRGIKWKKKK